jgi:predicted RND superfamily exporter protein
MGTMKDGKIGFIDGKLVYFKITYELNEYKNKNLEQQQELYKLNEEKMQEFNRGS